MTREAELQRTLLSLQAKIEHALALLPPDLATPAEHPDITLLRDWLREHPLPAPTSAHLINIAARRDLNRRSEFYPAYLKKALTDLGYVRRVESTGIVYHPPVNPAT